jgi:tetratricopeptide (TPR) repeat protein
MFVNPVKETETNRKGIVHVVSRLDWYWNLASLLLQEHPTDSTSLRSELKKRVVSLYQELLRYQMKSVCGLYRNRGLAFLRTMVQLDDWNGSLAKVNEAEAALRQDASDYRSQQLLQTSRQINQALEKLVEQLLLQADRQASNLKAAEPHAIQETKPVSRPMTVPFGRNATSFIGRKAALKELLELIPPGADENDCQRTAIEGLGGIGKTRLALEAAFRVRDDNQDCAIFWVPAIDVASFENAYLEIGRELGVEGIDDVTSGPNASGSLDPHSDKPDVKLLVKEALNRSSEPWLLIVDNADDVEVLSGSDSHVRLQDYLPFNRKGSILFTTRNHEVVTDLDIPLSNTITLQEMSWTEAMNFLSFYLTPTQMEDAEATVKLLSFLAYLPLALKQASAYMAKTKTSVTKYLAYCQKSDADLVRLLSKDFEDRGRYKASSNPITATWLISFRHISRSKPLAAKYLRFMSLLAERNIPRGVLPTDEVGLDSDEALATLASYAFINERVDTEAYDMHRLVRLATRNWMAQESTLQPCVSDVMRRLRGVYPFPDYVNKDLWMPYLPHALAALQFEDVASDREDEITLLDCVARSCTHTRDYQTATALYHRAIDLLVTTAGRESPVTLRLMHNLGSVYFSQAHPEEAEPLWREVLQLRMEVLGADHPDTLFSMDSLAVCLQMLGREQEAGTLVQQVYELKTELLGRADPDTLRTTQKLAEIMRRQGRYCESEQLSSKALVWMKEAQGSRHRDTLVAMKVLGITICDQGRPQEAEELFREVVQLTTETLGDAHPDTLSASLCLAATISVQGRAVEAEEMLQRNIDIRKEAFGLESAETVVALRDLARCYDRQEKLAEAEELYRQVVKLREKVHHPKSYQTMQAKTELAEFLHAHDRLPEAEAIYRAVFDLHKQVFGLEDAKTLEMMGRLPEVVREQGKLELATKLFRELVEQQQKVLGKEHLKTLESMFWFASVMQERELFEEAAETYRSLLPLQKQVLGPEHSHTLNVIDSLAYCIQQLGMYEEAEDLLQEVLDIRESVLGVDDDMTLAALDNLAYNLEYQERYGEAENLFRQGLERRRKCLGADASDTLSSLDNLKDILLLQGKREEAEELGPGDTEPTISGVVAAGMEAVPAQ